ncbi:MAG: hypothetical protein BWY80_00907 [Firmicutes bacterium ADurb.Bin456]|nr:MAG: hypothetical protein BWY80_00907 [Firmicutes bacterium ADurb.Bin456]
MDRIKSAYEMAMERFSKRKEVPRWEIDRMEYEPAGNRAAAVFLEDREYNLKAEIERHPQSTRGYVADGVEKTLLHNIMLPADQDTWEVNKRAMEGLLAVKKNKKTVEKLFGQLEHLFSYYEQALAQTYSQFKEHFSEKINAQVKLMEKRSGTKLNVNPEIQPGFQEEWLKIRGQLNDHYEKVLKELKGKLHQIQ